MHSKNEPKPGSPLRLRYLAYDIGRFLGVLPALLFLRPKCLYESDDAKHFLRGGNILIANHTSFWDPVVLLFTYWYRRLHIVAAKELIKNGAMRVLFAAMQTIIVDRSNIRLSLFSDVDARLRDRRIVALFPEGAVNRGGDSVNEFKSGAVLMALRAGVPIVPLYIAPRRHWCSRSVIVRGAAIDVKAACAAHPGMAGLNLVTEQLHDKEVQLASLYQDYSNRRKERK